jgi:transcriptional regulator with XRE-family HTH domain
VTQAEVAERMGTTQSVVARLESGARVPSMNTLLNFAKATRWRPIIKLLAARPSNLDRTTEFPYLG